DTITVYKANMIIPQIADNLTGRSRGTWENIIPDKCPACGGPAEIRADNDTEALYCINPDCPAKKIKAFTHFVSRDAMNIDGLSESTLEKFIGEGYIREFADIFRISDHKDELCKLEGFGEKSYNNLISAIDTSRTVQLPKLIYSLGIPNVGLSNAKIICREFDYDIEKMRKADAVRLSSIDNVGEVIARSFVSYFSDKKHNRGFDDLIKELTIEVPKLDSSNEAINGKTFVITGSLEHFENRNALKELIESKGGKVSGSVSVKTDYLINNDINSGSSKNKKAKELGVRIITENELEEMAGV
nr:NAD-dependent DNA ligase LigA [Lachnospiraceae bacterium]